MSQYVDKDRFREAIGLFATGVSVVTATSAGRPVGATAAAVCSLAREPLKLLVCVDNARPAHAALIESEWFAVNLLGEGQESLAERFALLGDADRFAGLPLEETKGLPLLRDAVAHFLCKRRDRIPGSDRSILVGKVTDLGLRRQARPLQQFGNGVGASTLAA
jgi:flavin reductase (DIM6/NTAB) family NADH-FMN oxidoreductase RutF